MRRLSRREFLVKGAAGAAALGAGGFPSLGLAGAEPELKIGYLPITDSAPLLVAHGLGYFREEGIKASMPRRVRSWSSLMESFLTGKFNLTHMLLPMPVWMRFKNRVPVKVLAWNHTNGSAMTVSGSSSVAGFSGLGGRRVAVPHWYSVHNVMLQMALRHHGLTPVIRPKKGGLSPDEVQVFVLSPPEMPAAFAGRKVDGYIVAEPINAISEVKAGARILRFTGDMWKNHPCCVVVMQEAVIRAHEAFVQRVMNAIVRAQVWIEKHRAEAARLLSRDGMGYLPMGEKVLAHAFLNDDPKVYGPSGAIQNPDWGVSRIGFQPWPYPSATRFLIHALSKTRVEGNADFLKGLNAHYAARELVDDRFVRRAMKAMNAESFFGLDAVVENPFEREEVLCLGRF